MLGPSRGPGEGPYLGTLVARVGLVPNAVLGAQFLALERLAPGRVIAGLGTGDRLSEEENRAYGIPFASAAERRADMVELGRELVAAGLPVWVAGGPAGRTEEARAAGAALNVWDAEPALVAERRAGPDGVEVTWAGPPPSASPPLAERLRALHERRRQLGRLRLAGRRRGAGRRRHASLGAEPRVRSARDPGPRLPRWSSAASTGCRPTSSPPSTTSRRRRGERARRHRPRLRESRPALARRGGGQAGRGRPEPAQPPLLRLARHPEAAQRHHGPLPAQVRRRARPRDPGGHHHRGQGGLLAPDVGAGRARGTPRWCPRRRTRSTSGARCSPGPTCARSRCRGPTWSRTTRPTRARRSSTGSCTPGRSPGPSRGSSCCPSRTTRPPPASTCPSWSAWWPSPASTRSSWCTTSPTPTSASTATSRRPSCRCPAPPTWRWRSTP